MDNNLDDESNMPVIRSPTMDMDNSMEDDSNDSNMPVDPIELKNRHDILFREREEERDHLVTLKSDLNELCRQKDLFEFESGEIGKLLDDIIAHIKNYQKNSRDAAKEMNQLMADYSNNSDNLLREHSSWQKTIRTVEWENVQRSLDLPKRFNEESLTDKLMDCNSKLNQVSALVDAESKKVKDIEDALKGRKALSKSVSTFTMYLRNLNFKQETK